MHTHKIILISALTAFAINSSAIKIEFSESNPTVLQYNADKNTGLNKIFVAYDTSSLTYIEVKDVDQNLRILKYGNLGGGYAEEIPFEMENGVARILRPEGNRGYLLEQPTGNFYFWLVDYSAFPLNFISATESSNQNCDNTTIDINGEGNAIHYYSIDGRQCELSRDIEVDYYNLEWNDDQMQYIQSKNIKTLSHLSSTLTLSPPLYCNTTLEFKGDKFLKAWNKELHYTSNLIHANGINAHTTAEQINLYPEDDNSEPSNVINTETQGMGGSAPAQIEFRAWVTDAVMHNEWQIASDMDFEYVNYRFNEQNLDYTFEEEGVYYVRFVASNSDGSCETYGDTYTIHIGASDLRIPNAFTPNGDGVNDVWKVSYRSLLSFKCSIFDRYGVEIISFTDPNLGWDGKQNGKTVKSGVYFYVIEATGSDGRKYKKGGDINVIMSKRYNNSSTSGE